MVVSHALHDDLLPWGHRRERLAPGNDNSTSLVGDRVAMRVFCWVFQQGIHALHELVGNSMLDLFRFRIDLVQRKAHDLDQKEFQQTMTANERGCHLLT